MITADQLVCHAAGDYVLQSDWMANEKTKQHTAAAVHALVYSLPFLAFRPSISAWLVILLTHFLIDRYRLARYVVWVKNFTAPAGANFPWNQCQKTGYCDERPMWMTVWLMIAADNIMHVLINGAALKYL